MTVKELQTSDVKTVSPDTDLAVVARLMWEGDCGAVPVVTEDRKVIGMITDRDICIAAATRAKPPAEIRAGDVITNHGVHAVKPDDDVRVAMRTMRKHKVRRLPVVDREQRLAGIVSINDLAIAASPSQPDSVPAQEFLETFQAICAHEKHAAAYIVVSGFGRHRT
jgi:CBS domain-containing protein